MIANQVLIFTLVLTRAATFIGVFPLFGGSTTPKLVRVTLALVLTVLWYGALGTDLPMPVWLGSGDVALWLGFGIALGREALLGLLLGFAFDLFLTPARVAGEYLTEEMGLSFGSQVDPNRGASTGALSQMFEAISAMIFLGLDGHHVVLAVFYHLLARHPIGAAIATPRATGFVMGVTATEQWGLLLTAPVALCLFMTTVVLALMTKAAPQLNMYSVGFPLRLVAGLAAIVVFLPHLLGSLVAVFGQVSELVLRFV